MDRPWALSVSLETVTTFFDSSQWLTHRSTKRAICSRNGALLSLSNVRTVVGRTKLNQIRTVKITICETGYNSGKRCS